MLEKTGSSQGKYRVVIKKESNEEDEVLTSGVSLDQAVSVKDKHDGAVIENEE